MWSHVDAFYIKLPSLTVFTLRSKGIRFSEVILSALLPFTFRPFLCREWPAVENHVRLYLVVTQESNPMHGIIDIPA